MSIVRGFLKAVSELGRFVYDNDLIGLAINNATVENSELLTRLITLRRYKANNGSTYFMESIVNIPPLIDCVDVI